MSEFEKQIILAMVLNSCKCAFYINALFITLCVQYTKPISQICKKRNIFNHFDCQSSQNLYNLKSYHNGINRH